MTTLESGNTSLKFKNKFGKRSDVDVMALSSWDKLSIFCAMSDYFSTYALCKPEICNVYILF